MYFSGQHGYISLSYHYPSSLFPQISGEADEWHLTLPTYTADWLDIVLYHRYTQLYAFLRFKRFLKLGVLEAVYLMHFADEENCNETSLKLSILFYHPGHFRQTGWKGVYFIKEENNKSSLPQTIKLLKSTPVSKARTLKPCTSGPPSHTSLSPASRSSGHVGAEGAQCRELLRGRIPAPTACPTTRGLQSHRPSAMQPDLGHGAASQGYPGFHSSSQPQTAKGWFTSHTSLINITSGK